jgi:hypothetical protein
VFWYFQPVLRILYFRVKKNTKGPSKRESFFPSQYGHQKIQNFTLITNLKEYLKKVCQQNVESKTVFLGTWKFSAKQFSGIIFFSVHF